jgi:hypothetical protein
MLSVSSSNTLVLGIIGYKIRPIFIPFEPFGEINETELFNNKLPEHCNRYVSDGNSLSDLCIYSNICYDIQRDQWQLVDEKDETVLLAHPILNNMGQLNTTVFGGYCNMDFQYEMLANSTISIPEDQSSPSDI